MTSIQSELLPPPCSQWQKVGLVLLISGQLIHEYCTLHWSILTKEIQFICSSQNNEENERIILYKIYFYYNKMNLIRLSFRDISVKLEFSFFFAEKKTKNNIVLHLKVLKVDISFCMFLLKSLFKMFSWSFAKTIIFQVKIPWKRACSNSHHIPI